MLSIRNISLVQFKNYGESQFRFEGKVTAITGHNGAGKTSLLDAIHYLCCTRSYFHSGDQQSVRFDTDGFRIEGDFLKGDREDRITCILRGAGKKEFSLNGVPYTRFSTHIGHFPAVMVAPDDGGIITGASHERRKFLDILLAQMDSGYLEELIAYNRVLQQRNSHLKELAEGSRSGNDLLDTLDVQLAGYGLQLHAKRKSFLENFVSRVQQLYDYMAGNHETVEIHYRSTLSEQDFLSQLRHHRPRDILLLRTTAGIHRDDLEFLLNGHPLKNSGSQGQRKSFLFALKLSEYEFILERRGLSPLLLLDDVFEKLDSRRISKLISLVCTNGFGQVFITDTDKTRLQTAFRDYPGLLQVIEL